LRSLQLGSLSPRGMSLSASASGQEGSGGGLGLLGLTVFGGITLGTGALGVWQYSRYNEKVEMVKARVHSLEDSPRKVRSFQALDDSPMFSKVVLEGTYMHGKEMKLVNRPPPEARRGPQGGLATGPVGKYIITPLELADGSVVFVNRGWAPRNSSTWNQPKGRVSITGVKTGMEVQKTFSPPNFPFKDGGNIFWLEEPAMKVYAGMDPAKATAYVQLVDEKDHTLVLKGNEDFKKFPVMPETHLGYAATWLGLCCFGVIMTIVRARG